MSGASGATDKLVRGWEIVWISTLQGGSLSGSVARHLQPQESTTDWAAERSFSTYSTTWTSTHPDLAAMVS